MVVVAETEMSQLTSINLMAVVMAVIMAVMMMVVVTVVIPTRIHQMRPN